MPEPIFEFFERVALELSETNSKVLTHEDFRIGKDTAPLLEDLMKSLKAVSLESTIPVAVEKLREHFDSKDSQIPFSYDSSTGRFTATDQDFLKFVTEMKDIRTIGKRAMDFEHSVAKRLAAKTTGSVHRVGFPRNKKKKSAQFNDHLQTLGFDEPVLKGRDKDGGFDILWMLPLATIPHRPVVSVQCKNSEYDIDDADKSVAAGRRSLSKNSRLQPSAHVLCVLFNDYLHPEKVTEKAIEFIPLGLTDLALLKNPPPAVQLL